MGERDPRILIDDKEIPNARERVKLDPETRGVFLDGDFRHVIKWDRVKVYHPTGIPVNGKIVQWEMVHEQKPDTIDNGKSRMGFAFNPYWSRMGRFFQETVKKGFVSIIKRIHDKEIPRYDKNAYQFDDPRLKFIHDLLMRAMKKHINDNDIERKHEIFGDFNDIICFMMKEDIYYRAVILSGLKDLAVAYNEHPEFFALDDTEGFHYDKFRIENWLNNTLKDFSFEYYMAKKQGAESLKPEQPKAEA